MSRFNVLRDPPEIPADVLADVVRPPGTLLAMYRGSVTHGMCTPPTSGGVDDVDTMSVVIAPETCYLGLSQWGSRGTKETTREMGDFLLDHVGYELTKYVSLLLNSNPNVLGMLWLAPEHYLHVSPQGQRLIDNRDLFASKHAYNSFTGYAYSQLKRLHRPSRGYMGKERKRLFKKFGYDTKNASHLIRLLRMGIDFIQTGQMQVDRTGIDADELLAIKEGGASLEWINTEAERGFAEAKAALETSVLPDEPNRDEAERLVVSILRQELDL